MKDLEITKQLRDDIESNQNQLKNAIRNHQVSWYFTLFCLHVIKIYGGLDGSNRDTLWLR